jgi:hypothetical protein
MPCTNIRRDLIQKQKPLQNQSNRVKHISEKEINNEDTPTPHSFPFSRKISEKGKSG